MKLNAHQIESAGRKEFDRLQGTPNQNSVVGNFDLRRHCANPVPTYQKLRLQVLLSRYSSWAESVSESANQPPSSIQRSTYSMKLNAQSGIGGRVKFDCRVLRVNTRDIAPTQTNAPGGKACRRCDYKGIRRGIKCPTQEV